MKTLYPWAIALSMLVGGMNNITNHRVQVFCEVCRKPMIVPQSAINAKNYHMACMMESMPRERTGLNAELLEQARKARNESK